MEFLEIGEVKMWYVIQTIGGEEEATADMIERAVPKDIVEECFVPKREKLKKFCGQWNKVDEVLFKGYVFVVSEKAEKLHEELRHIPRMTKILGREEESFYPLSEKDEKLVRDMGDKKHKTLLSQITVGEGKRIQVLEGPLKGYEGNVVKVNLHKREVVVRIEFMGKYAKLHMGIEMADMGKLK